MTVRKFLRKLKIELPYDPTIPLLGIYPEKTIIRKDTGTPCGEKGTLLHCWWECKLIQPLWRTVWRFLKKLKIELPYNPAIPLWAYTLRKP